MVKAVLFDDDMTPLADATTVVPVGHPGPGRSEQDMTTVRDAVDEVVAQVAPADGRVDAVAVTAQGDGCWLVDAHGDPTGPALLWNDARAGDVVARWETSGLLQRAFDVNGSWGNAGLAHAQLTWLAEHEPARVDAAEHLLSCGSWIYLGLTGRAALDVSDACNPFLDAATDQVSLPLLADLDLAWAARLLPDVVTGADRVASLSEDAARRTGLLPGTPVTLAPYDVVATAVGAAAVTTGTGFAVLGTTLCVGTPVEGSGLPREPAGMSLATGEPGRRLLAHATLAGTEVLDWWARVLGLASAADVTGLAGTAEPRPDAPMLLPYLSPAGERAPFRDPAAHGALVGLTLEHGREDVARAVVEGLSLAVLDCLQANGGRPEQLSVCGGGSRSAVWCQALADVTGIPVARVDNEQVGAGGAVLTAMAALSGRAVADLVDDLVHHHRAVEPDPVEHERHREGYERFVDARRSGVPHA